MILVNILRTAYYRYLKISNQHGHSRLFDAQSQSQSQDREGRPDRGVHQVPGRQPPRPLVPEMPDSAGVQEERQGSVQGHGSMLGGKGRGGPAEVSGEKITLRVETHNVCSWETVQLGKKIKNTENVVMSLLMCMS